MSLELTQNELNSYQEKYNKIVKAKVVLNFSKTKKIIMDQFSITDVEANNILNKVFAHQNQPEMNKEGFYTTLKYIQCLQNGLNIDTININTVKLSFPLKVNSRLKKSFQPIQKPNTNDPLDKSMIFVQQMEKALKETNINQQNQQNPTTKIEIQDEQINNDIKVIETNQNNEPISDIKNETEDDKQKETIIQQQIEISPSQLAETQQQQDQPVQELISTNPDPCIEQTIEKFNEINITQEQIPLVLNPINKQDINTQNSFGQLGYEIQKIQHQDIIELSDEEDGFNSQEINGQQSDKFYVWIANYEIQNGKSFSQNYYTYTVCSEFLANKEDSNLTKYIVKRRYTDFKMLQKYFIETKQGDIIPGLPEGEGIIGSLVNLVRENTEKLNQRLEQLQLFLRELVKSYKEDSILLRFLTIDQTFESIINTLRYEKGDTQDEDDFLPNPEDYTIKEKIKRGLGYVVPKSLAEYQTLLVDFIKGNPQIEAKFQEEYRQVQQHYKNLENKKQELIKFESELIRFYEIQEPFQFQKSQIILTNIITEENITKVQIMQKIFNQYQFKKQNEVLNQVKQMRYQLDSLTFSYQRIQKQIYKWFQEKQRLQQDKNQKKKEIQQNDTEEGRLQFVISRTNDTLIKFVAQISQNLDSLLNDFVYQLTTI